jgi:hypothetical protein
MKHSLSPHVITQPSSSDIKMHPETPSPSTKRQHLAVLVMHTVDRGSEGQYLGTNTCAPLVDSELEVRFCGSRAAGAFCSVVEAWDWGFGLGYGQYGWVDLDGPGVSHNGPE